MQMDVPQDLVDRLRHLTAIEKLESEVHALRKALDSLESDLQERHAIQQGIDAWKAGDIKELEQFDTEFRARNGIPNGDG
jgi:hypothetical protein